MAVILLAIAYAAIIFYGEPDDTIISSAFVNPESKKLYQGY